MLLHSSISTLYSFFSTLLIEFSTSKYSLLICLLRVLISSTSKSRCSYTGRWNERIDVEEQKKKQKTKQKKKIKITSRKNSDDGDSNNNTTATSDQLKVAIFLRCTRINRNSARALALVVRPCSMCMILSANANMPGSTWMSILSLIDKHYFKTYIPICIDFSFILFAFLSNFCLLLSSLLFWLWFGVCRISSISTSCRRQCASEEEIKRGEKSKK